MTSLESVLHRALAASDAMAVIFLVLATLILGYRRFGPLPAEQIQPIKTRKLNVDQMLTSLAVQRVGFALHYAVMAGALMGYWPAASLDVVIARLVAVYLVIGASIAMLHKVLGRGAMFVFVGLGALAGGILYLWG